MNIAQVYEKVKFKDVIGTIKDIIIGDKPEARENYYNQKLEKIYKVELEIGATQRISNLKRDMENHKAKEKRTNNISTKVLGAKKIFGKENKNKENEENMLEQEMR